MLELMLMLMLMLITLRSDIDPTLRSDAVVDLSLDNIEALAAEIAAESNIPLPRDTAPTPAPTKSLSSLAAPHPKAEWQIQKAALQQKLGPSGWAPRKRLSPDALSGIRALHAQYPDEYPTPVLAARFGVSAEAIRRILKSRWRPSDDEETARRERWSKRGEKIWSNMVELGVKPPKKWRDMGIGRGRQSGGRARQSGHRSSDQCTGMDRRRTPSSGPRDGARESGEEWDPGAETEPAPTLGERIL
ncbi:MAG: Required for respiratory growth protein 9 mitochondrial [Thelocarpon superellum]|nr:MAG: Required for respiratory growth protein 9 mitochondrial [Thelocarpon superellum]